MTSRVGPADGEGVAPELVFELQWRRPAKSSPNKREDGDRASIGIWDSLDTSGSTTLDLLSFKSYICQNLGSSGDVAVSYVDSDGDDLPIDSQCEFQEALKFARDRAKRNRNVQLLIDKIDKQSSASEKSAPKKVTGNPASDQLFIFKAKPLSSASKNTMAPVTVNEVVENVSEKFVDGKLNNIPSPLPAQSDAIPPAWFKNYMEMLKKEIVTEVSTKVMANVMVVLNSHASESCPSCSHRSDRRGKYSRDNHQEDKQQRRKKKRVVEELESSDAMPSSQHQDSQLLRKVKKIERERKLETKLNQKLERLEKKTRVVLEKKKRCLEVTAIPNDLDKSSCQESIVTTDAAAITQTKSADLAANIPGCINGKIRMNCSVTGNELLDKPTFRDMEYFSDSDSDNISIISGVSNISDLDHENNFEMVPMPSCFILDKPLNNCDLKTPGKPEKSACSPSPTVCDVESDRNNNRDSPSYELLSEPLSRASSIHLDEDHFHMNQNISTAPVSNSDLIDFNNEEFESRKDNAYIVDKNGVIFRENILNESDKSNEMNLEKRPGGVYAYKNETLPSHNLTADPVMSKSEINVEHPEEIVCNAESNMKSSHPSYTTNALKSDTSGSQSQADLGGARSQESTYSFSSHTTLGSGLNSHNFSAVRTHKATQVVGGIYKFVDGNVNKGLGDTKYTSNGNKFGNRAHESKTKETSGKYQRGFTSESSACVFTEQPRRSGVKYWESTPEEQRAAADLGHVLPETLAGAMPASSQKSGLGGSGHSRESTPEQGRIPTDPVHILPETLVSGAVNVASHAYSTARKVFDKIRNMQTGEDHEETENGVAIGSEMERCFSMLADMGFNDIPLNARLLNQYNYDLSRVITELVQ